MKIRELLEAASSGGTGSGAIATVTNPGGKPANEVGTFFGGSFERNLTNKPKTKKVKVIRR
jgi:hypothetical protein